MNDNDNSNINDKPAQPINFPIQYILAPMVGASELPFRLLTRNYGVQTAYTPMLRSRLETVSTPPSDRHSGLLGAEGDKNTKIGSKYGRIYEECFDMLSVL